MTPEQEAILMHCLEPDFGVRAVFVDLETGIATIGQRVPASDNIVSSADVLVLLCAGWLDYARHWPTTTVLTPTRIAEKRYGTSGVL